MLKGKDFQHFFCKRRIQLRLLVNSLLLIESFGNKKWRAKLIMSCTPFFNEIVIYNYLTSSKINTIVNQIDKRLMVQIWFLKFIKSILYVIPMLFSSVINFLFSLICYLLAINII